MQFQLNVVRVPEREQRPTVLVLDAGVRHPKSIEVLYPLFEDRAVANVEREVVQTDCSFVERVGDRVLVCHQSDVHPARMEHSPDMEAGLVNVDDKVKPEDVVPPLSATRSVGHGEVDVPEAFDSRWRHSTDSRCQ